MEEKDYYCLSRYQGGASSSLRPGLYLFGPGFGSGTRCVIPHQEQLFAQNALEGFERELSNCVGMTWVGGGPGVHVVTTNVFPE